jgi:hypothetical protein
VAHRRAKLTALGRQLLVDWILGRRHGRRPCGGHGRREPPDGLEVAAPVRGRGAGGSRGSPSIARRARLSRSISNRAGSRRKVNSTSTQERWRWTYAATAARHMRSRGGFSAPEGDPTTQPNHESRGLLTRLCPLATWWIRPVARSRRWRSSASRSAAAQGLSPPVSDLLDRHVSCRELSFQGSPQLRFVRPLRS